MTVTVECIYVDVECSTWRADVTAIRKEGRKRYLGGDGPVS